MQKNRRLSDGEWLALREDAAARLSRGESRNNVIFDICCRTSLTWPEAEALLRKIEFTEHKRISRGRGFLLLLVSLAMIVQGLILVNPISENILNSLFWLVRDFSPLHISLLREAILQNWLMVVLWMVFNISALAGIVAAVSGMIEPV